MAWYREARALWRDRNATSVAACAVVDRPVLADEPRLRDVLDSDLRRQVMDAPAPLSWRRVDARWALRNLGRAVLGRLPAPAPYDEHIAVQVVTDGLFERNQVRVVAERTRRAHV